MIGSREAPIAGDTLCKRHDIVRGRVRCPLQGDVDVELCFYCPFTEAVDMDSSVRTITCIPDMTMSAEDKVAYQRLGLLRLAQTIGNVSRVCRERGISRTQFYKYRDRYLAEGIAGLRDSPMVTTRNKQVLPESVTQSILDLNLAHPTIGCVRVAEMLQSHGIDVTPVTVQSTLMRQGLGTKQKRLARLEELYITQGYSLSAEQMIEVEHINPCFRERHSESKYPGELLAQDTLYVGQLRGLGKIYMQAVVDTFGSYAFGFLHSGKLPKYAVTVLQNDVLRFFKHRGIVIKAIITDNGREYCGTQAHPYEYYLALNGIEHQRTQVHSHLIHGFVEAFNIDVIDEFFKPAFRERNYDSLASLQWDLEQWLSGYNNERAHPGYRNMGKSPMQMISDYLANRRIQSV